MLPRTVKWLLLTLLLLSGQPRPLAAASLQGEVRLLAARAEPAWVGQEVELYLELWTDGFSFGDQLFVLPEVKGGFLLQGDSSTVKLSESRAGASWQGLRYTLLLYPQAAGRLEVPPFEVRFTSRAGFGSEPTTFAYRTEPLAIEARLPPGVNAGDLLVTTGNFKLEAKWDRDLPGEGALQLQTGDAITLEVRRRAEGVPGMVFAPLPVPAIAGLGVYPAAPSVGDTVNRGELSGARTDSVTFVCESEGSFMIPELRFQWWNPDEERLAERVMPALMLEVRINPVFGAGAATVEPAPHGLAAPLLAALVAVSIATVLWLGRARWAPRLAERWLSRSGARPHEERRTGRLLPLNPRP
jgi:hypothetical protein